MIDPEFRNDAELLRIIDDIDAALASPAARIFKNDPASIVGSVPFHDSWLVIKKYKRYAHGKNFHRAFRKSRARRTWEGAHHLRAAGIDTVTPVALVEYRIGPFCVDACFIGKPVEGTDAYTFFTSGEIPDRLKRQAARHIILSLRKLHAAGFSHGDTKHTNLFIQGDRISWIDLDALRLKAPEFLMRRRTRKDWLLLINNWRRKPRVRDIFMAELKEHFDAKDYSRLMRDADRRWGKKRISPRMSGIPRKTVFSMSDSRGGKTGVSLYVPDPDGTAFWRDIIENYWKGSLGGLQRHRSSGTARVESCLLWTTRYYFKRFYPRNAVDHLKQIFRKSRACRDLKGILLARARGLHVPDVCCVAEISKWGVRVSSIIVTREVGASMQLHHLLQRYQRNGDFRSRRRLARRIGEEMAKWHLSGMRHGDARDTNILCIMPADQESAPDLPVDFCWLDNERSRPAIRKKVFIRNLVQLNMTRSGITVTDRIRFWQSYWAQAGRIFHPMTETDVRRRVAAWTRKRWKERGWL